MAKRKSESNESNVAVVERGPIDPHESNVVADVNPAVESNEPITTDEKPDVAGAVFEAERSITDNAKATKFPFVRLFRRDNVRTTGNFSSERLEDMVASLKARGFRPEYPVTVSLKDSPVDADGHDGLVLKGNRRVQGLEWLYLNDRETFDRILPDGMVPAIVYEGLTAQEEAIIRIDHSKEEDRTPLTEFEEFLAVKQLVRVGWGTESAIADKLGKVDTDDKGVRKPKRSWVQARVALAKMPQFVQDEMQKFCEKRTSGGVKPGEASRMNWSDIRQTKYKIPAGTLGAGSEEQTVSGLEGAKNLDMKNAAKGWINGEGPAFQFVWNAINNPTDSSTTPRPVSLTQSTVTAIAGRVSSRNLREALSVLNTPDQPGLIDIDGAMVRAEHAEETLAAIAAYMGEEAFAELLDKAKAHAQANSAG